MQTETLLYIILAGITALLLAFFQYLYKHKKSISKLDMLFSFLRFLTIFSVLLLLINPKFDQISLTTEKPNLVIAVDNSNSIKHLKQDKKALGFIKNIKKNKDLNDKFNITTYSFGEAFEANDSITFSEKQTNIDDAFKQLSQIYKQTISPTVLITDGNQTIGSDYEYGFFKHKQSIYPVVLGDTTVYADLRIKQLNVNRYAFLKNRFPIEAILLYNGENAVSSRFVVKKGNTTVYSEIVKFDKTNNSKIVNFTLPANQVGVSSYKASLIPVDSEKNKINNHKNFAVEVIDQKTKIAIVSDFSHPDIGVLKKSIESNEQRSVTIIDPLKILNQINDFQLIIVYQPSNRFKRLFEALNEENKNRFIIIGPKTDLNFINRINKEYQLERTSQTEDYQAELNTNYSPFIIDDIDFESFPPLKSNYGTVNFSIPFQSILNKRVKSISINEPLLATLEVNNRREAVLFGENIWQWRAHSYMNSKTFNKFDDFIGKMVQYLASNKRRNRLGVEYESFYNGNTNIIIKAQFFDKNYNFDARETLRIILKDKVSGEEKIFPLILKNNNYQVDLSSLKPSEYNFTIKAKNENISKSGTFQVLEYSVEQQFLNANVTKLKQLATNSLGKAYFIDNAQGLIEDLMNDERYVSIQKSNKNSLPLVDWKYLLIIIALSLTIEWFLRKYNGLI